MNAKLALYAGLLSATTISATAAASPHHPQRPYVRPPAQAPAYAPATVEIDNETGLMVDVFIDGVFRGSIRDDQEANFTSDPGLRRVTVQLQDGSLAYDDHVQLYALRETEIDLRPMLATLVLDNDGVSPLWVTVPGIAPFWLMPNTNQRLQVAPGLIHVEGAMYGKQGLRTVVSQDLYTRPASTLVADLGWSPPPPASRLTVRNLENSAIRVYIGGNEVAALQPGEASTLEVRPGQHMVTIVSNRGGILYNDHVGFTDDQVRSVLIRDGRYFDEGTSRWDRGQPVAWVRR
jgi:hypothetical protein